MKAQEIYDMIDSSKTPLEDVLNTLSKRGSIQPEDLLQKKLNEIVKECDETCELINQAETKEDREALKIALNYLTGKKNGIAYALGVIG
jgi:hypothetical protein